MEVAWTHVEMRKRSHCQTGVARSTLIDKEKEYDQKYTEKTSGERNGRKKLEEDEDSSPR